MATTMAIHREQAMGGRLELRAAMSSLAELETIARRIRAWSAQLTRHEPSALTRLNADPRLFVPVGPTLAAALAAGRRAGALTDGLVDITRLDARLAAESGTERAHGDQHRWGLRVTARDGLIERDPAGGVRFDLGGIAKGWLADRALALLPDPTALVDCDGDLALRVGDGERQELEVADPDERERPLLRLLLPPGRYGVATSGTDIHRWGTRHHLIDPRTDRPAASDLRQATVIAASALEAEAFAKALVIAGSAGGFALLERAGIRYAFALDRERRLLSTPAVRELLA